MPISLVDLMQDERTIPVLVGQDPETGDDIVINITYRPSGLTPVVESESASLTTRFGLGPGVAVMLAGMMTDWDLEVEPGVKLDPTFDPNNPEDGMGCVPDYVLFKIRDAIILDVRQSRETLKNSGGGSHQKAKSGSARTGSRSRGRQSSLA